MQRRDFLRLTIRGEVQYASLENLKQIRGYGWNWLSRLKGNRQVTPEDRIGRSLNEVAFVDSGVVVLLRAYSPVLVSRIDAPDGVAEYRASGDLTMDAGMRGHHAESGLAIENYHRELKRNCGVERSQARFDRALRNHIGLALRAFLRLE